MLSNLCKMKLGSSTVACIQMYDRAFAVVRQLILRTKSYIVS